VEDRLRQPLLSLSDYQTRRDGVEGQAKVRRNRLEGDNWVREFMEGLDVLVNDEAARQLVEVVRGALQEEELTPQTSLKDQEIQIVRSELEPETALVRYTLDGEERIFSMADFVRWLPELAYDEIRDRPISAVGRALRSEVLGRQGLASGLETDLQSREAIQHAQASFLADTLRGLMRVTERAEPTAELIEDAYSRLGFRKLQSATADVWIIDAPSLRAADSLQALIQTGTRTPQSLPNYRSQMSTDIRRGPLAGYLRRVPLDTPTVLCLEGPACKVVQVSKRTIDYTTLQESEEQIREMLSRLLPEERLGDSLLQARGVRIDTTLFVRMMDL
jgi:hypothetical protein